MVLAHQTPPEVPGLRAIQILGVPRHLAPCAGFAFIRCIVASLVK